MQLPIFMLKNYPNLRKGIVVYSKTIFQPSNGKWTICANFVETTCPNWFSYCSLSEKKTSYKRFFQSTNNTV